MAKTYEISLQEAAKLLVSSRIESTKTAEYVAGCTVFDLTGEDDNEFLFVSLYCDSDDSESDHSFEEGVNRTVTITSDGVLTLVDAQGEKVEIQLLGKFNYPPVYESDYDEVEVKMLSHWKKLLRRNPAKAPTGDIGWMREMADIVRAHGEVTMTGEPEFNPVVDRCRDNKEFVIREGKPRWEPNWLGGGFFSAEDLRAIAAELDQLSKK
jgi:hypothetical protein